MKENNRCKCGSIDLPCPIFVLVMDRFIIMVILAAIALIICSTCGSGVSITMFDSFIEFSE